MEHLADTLLGVSLKVDAFPHSDLTVTFVLEKIGVGLLDTLMDDGWVIMSSWIENPTAVRDEEDVVEGISFRLGLYTARVILTTDVPIGTPWDKVPNIDADFDTSITSIVPGMKSTQSRLRAASISSYGPYASRGPGLRRPLKLPKLSIVGLDIEVSTTRRSPGMPLPMTRS